MTATGSPSVTAHAPGSVTIIFAPPSDLQEGSFGVSFAIADGVAATVQTASETRVSLDGDRTAFAPVEIALREFGVTAEVSLAAEIPVGYGFGASGAATLATTLATNELAGLEMTREKLVEVAHYAEVEAGTGLGDVFIQSRGGLLWNTGDGRERVERDEPIEYTAFGGIATEDILTDEETTDRVRTVGRESRAQFSPDASLGEQFDLARDFAERTGLTTDRVIEAVRRVEAAGGVGTMAMVGETVVATGVQDVLEERTRIENRGAHVR